MVSGKTASENAMFQLIQSDAYEINPAAFPLLPDYVWEDLEMGEVVWRMLNPNKAHPREVYEFIGKGELQHALLLMAINNLADKPEGFASTIMALLTSPNVISAVLNKLKGSMTPMKRMKRVDAAFYVFVGAVWSKVCDGDTEAMLDWLGPIFLPLLRVGGAAYVSHAAAHGPKSLPLPTSSAGVRTAMTVQFLEDFREMQISASRSSASHPWISQKIHDYSPKSPAAIPSFGRLTKELSPMRPIPVKRAAPQVSSLDTGSRTPAQDSWQDPYPELKLWTPTPSPSRIDAVLGIPPQEHLVDPFANDASRTPLQFSQDPEQNSSRGTVTALLPAVQLTVNPATLSNQSSIFLGHRKSRWNQNGSSYRRGEPIFVRTHSFVPVPESFPVGDYRHLIRARGFFYRANYTEPVDSTELLVVSTMRRVLHLFLLTAWDSSVLCTL
ncbi:hypothetical protein B0H15DRAFT_836636 [Mycena belliarum]|uniref:Uncharacterized protein n=1 Tax=Mycena belliarum TaxID=1033014 RepID=A0AAD6U8U0_9AGAR|nr:hypothetical protein B0H15DRAFT_836636 [Mycena belliae]